MQKYTTVEYEQASPEVRAIYDEMIAAFGGGKLNTALKALGSNPKLLRGTWEKIKSCLLTGTVPILLKELIQFSISTKRGARYCSAAHAHTLLKMDKTLTYKDLTNLVAGKAYKDMPKAFKVAVDVITKAGIDPNSLTDKDFLELEQAGFSQAEVVELMAQAELAVMSNTYTSSYQFPIDPEYLADQKAAA